MIETRKNEIKHKKSVDFSSWSHILNNYFCNKSTYLLKKYLKILQFIIEKSMKLFHEQLK